MGPFLRSRLDRLPWEPEVMAIRPARSRSRTIAGHRGDLIVLPNGGRGIQCSCGWVTRDRRRFMANWRRHQDRVRGPVESF